MSQQQQPVPKSSGRRRNGRHGTPQKNYASENDAANYRQYHSDSPYTPQRLASHGNGAQHNVQSANQKQRKASSTKKTRNKQDRPSPIQHTVPMAFAGASFTSSPAPNSLPMPSFLARTSSAPDSPSLEPSVRGPSQELSPPTTDSEEDGTPSPHPAPPPRADESPLEFFFKADRAEKARVRRASSANAASLLAGPFSPPHDSPQPCSTFPRLSGPAAQAQAQAQARRPQVQRNPSSGIPASELDGNPGKPFGQAFSTPYSERIKAARTKNGPIQASPIPPKHDPSGEALMRFLMTGQKMDQPEHLPVQKPSVSSPSAPNGHISVQQHTPHRHAAPAHPVLESPIHMRGQSQPYHSPDVQAEQMRRMEDSLRRVLKLGPS